MEPAKGSIATEPSKKPSGLNEEFRMPEMHKSGVRDYLRAAEAAALLHVSPKTIGRWAKEGKVAHIVTLGGHRRFSRADVERLVRAMESSSADGRVASVGS